MKKIGIVLIVIIAIVAIIAFTFIGNYNKMVTLQEKIDNATGNLENQLQRRMDLIPNLVNTVKGFTSHENEIIEKVTTAREKLAGANSIEEKSEADAELTSSLKALMVIVENYPDLKSSDNFIQLSDELAGTENRIAVARKEYNDAVTEYNTTIKKFPNNIISGMFGFEKATYFEAKEGADVVPEVNFN